MSTARLLTLAILLLGFHGDILASEHDMCFASAAKRFNVDMLLLKAIGKVESDFQPNAINRGNGDGSEDYGMMQNNSSKLPVLIKAGFKKSDLFDPCTSIYLGAHNLHTCIKRHGNTWRAVGCYNAGSRKSREGKRKQYVRKVHAAYEVLKRQRQTKKKRGNAT